MEELGHQHADVFYNNDAVTFDDTGSTGNVTINAAVAPGSVTFNNNSLTYTLASSGFGNRITGLTGLSKSGSGTVVLASDNDYSGPTAINRGVLVLGSINAAQNSTVGINVDNGLAFLPGVSAFTVGGLSGSGRISLVRHGRRRGLALLGRQWQRDDLFRSHQRAGGACSEWPGQHSP